jgi:hypothetical protein
MTKMIGKSRLIWIFIFIFRILDSESEKLFGSLRFEISILWDPGADMHTRGV